MISAINKLLKTITRKYPSKINLLIELDSFDKGGLQKVILDSALLFNKSKYTVTIVSIGHAGYLSEIAKKKGLFVCALENKNKERMYNRIIQERKINLSCSHFSSFGYPILKKNNIPNITFIHNVYAFLCGEALKDFIENDKYVDFYISVSKNATRYANERLGIASEKIITVPNGLIVEEHEERRNNSVPISKKDYGILPEDYLFLNVASYNLHKGHYLMADAMKKVLKKRNDIKIICIGNVICPPHINELREYLRDSGLDNHIIIPGYFSNIESFYVATDAFILPSFIEGWSIAMNEAMFYEKPMILTDTGASAEVIENNDIGILLPNEYGDIIELNSEKLDDIAYNQRNYNTSGLLAEAMIEFADNKSKWKEAGKKGKKKILTNYNFNDIVNKYESIFQKIVSNPF